MARSHSVFGLESPFIELLGAREEHWGDGRAVLSCDPAPETRNSWGVAHGGLMMTLLDTAMGGAAITVGQDVCGAVTTSISVTFLRAGSGALVAEGRVMGSGQSVVFCEGEVRDRAGELLAKAVGTFKVRRRA